ncbi:hypothetical protein FHP25_32555 [Vineibacter terrae]|uniref:Uncharacterized protein n=1 Tax=Vineibacter terrae TaxID=2586908 RepID=A0A5C8PCP5_9HYPH|nr:hypothetical protein [Vineibacter terrae]TXL70854.1 hypothetical protein FHP25_32555 [Vineibacter terrae]
MIYAYAYLCVGVLTLISVLGAHMWQVRREPASFTHLVDALHPERITFKYLLLEKVLVPVLTGLFIVLAWPIACAVMLGMKFSRKSKASAIPVELRRKEFAVSPSSLGCSFTLDEIERLEVIDDPLGATPRSPFGHLNAHWEKFKSDAAPGSEIWSFREKWQPRWGAEETRSGYVELRQSEIGAVFIKAIEPADFRSGA